MSAMLALEKANDARLEIAALRKAIRTGDMDIVDVFDDPPACLQGVAIFDVVRLGYSRSRGQATPGIERLGRLALRDGINLALPLGKASLRTRRWVALHIQWHKGSGRRAGVEDAA